MDGCQGDAAVLRDVASRLGDSRDRVGAALLPAAVFGVAGPAAALTQDLEMLLEHRIAGLTERVARLREISDALTTYAGRT